MGKNWRSDPVGTLIETVLDRDVLDLFGAIAVIVVVAIPLGFLAWIIVGHLTGWWQWSPG